MSQTQRKIFLTREEIEQRVYHDDEPLTKIAAEIGVAIPTLRDYIKRRGMYPSRLAWLKADVLTAETLQRRYVADELSIRELAREFRCSPETIRKQLCAHGIEQRAGASERQRQLMSKRIKALHDQGGIYPKAQINERGERLCGRCKRWQPADGFVSARCKLCNREVAREWARTHADRVRVRQASEAAAEFGVIDTLTEDEWLAIADEFDGRCFYCGEAAYGIEHVIPLAQGGPNTKGNIVPACRACNHAKRSARTDLLEALARIRAVQTEDEDFELVDLSGRSFASGDAERADALVTGVIQRLTLVPALATV